jgi:hypothetical protein
MTKPIANPIAFTGQSPPWSLTQLDANFASFQAAINDTLTYSNYFVDQSGVVNSIIISVPTTLAIGLIAGTQVAVKIANTNTLAAVTVTINALTAQKIVNPNGSALSPGQLVAGGIALLWYDGAQFQFLGYARPVNVIDFGADPTGGADSTAAFRAAANASLQVSVPAGTYAVSPFIPLGTTWLIDNGAIFSGTNNIPVSSNQIKFGNYPNTWVNGVGGGVFEYLESQAAFNVRGHIMGIGEFISGRSSTATGAGVGAIDYAAFVYNDNTAVASDVWGYYLTALRVAGATGHTHGMELDVLNTGALVSWFPGQGFPAGLTDCLWIAAGGEFAATAVTVNPATCAIGIVRNDASARATFDRGLIFQNTAINGTDGATGTGIAIALATGHAFEWFNNSNNLTAYIYAQAGLAAANGTGIIFSNSGMEIVTTVGGSVLVDVPAVASAVNHLLITAATTGNAVQVTAQGSDATVDLSVSGQGGGSFVQLGASYNAAADPPTTGYITVKDSSGTARKLAVLA